MVEDSKEETTREGNHHNESTLTEDKYEEILSDKNKEIARLQKINAEHKSDLRRLVRPIKGDSPQTYHSQVVVTEESLKYRDKIFDQLERKSKALEKESGSYKHRLEVILEQLSTQKDKNKQLDNEIKQLKDRNIKQSQFSESLKKKYRDTISQKGGIQAKEERSTEELNDEIGKRDRKINMLQDQNSKLKKKNWKIEKDSRTHIGELQDHNSQYKSLLSEMEKDLRKKDQENRMQGIRIMELRNQVRHKYLKPMEQDSSRTSSKQEPIKDDPYRDNSKSPAPRATKSTERRSSNRAQKNASASKERRPAQNAGYPRNQSNKKEDPKINKRVEYLEEELESLKRLLKENRKDQTSSIQSERESMEGGKNNKNKEEEDVVMMEEEKGDAEERNSPREAEKGNTEEQNPKDDETGVQNNKTISPKEEETMDHVEEESREDKSKDEKSTEEERRSSGEENKESGNADTEEKKELEKDEDIDKRESENMEEERPTREEENNRESAEGDNPNTTAQSNIKGNEEVEETKQPPTQSEDTGSKVEGDTGSKVEERDKDRGEESIPNSNKYKGNIQIKVIESKDVPLLEEEPERYTLVLMNDLEIGKSALLEGQNPVWNYATKYPINITTQLELETKIIFKLFEFDLSEEKLLGVVTLPLEYILNGKNTWISDYYPFVGGEGGNKGSLGVQLCYIEEGTDESTIPEPPELQKSIDQSIQIYIFEIYKRFT